MQIKSYLYRRPSYLSGNKLELIDTIVIHHTGNNNSIDTNTDYHMDNNGWSFLGYNFYIVNGEIFKVRGTKYKAAAVSGHNEHTINIAVQGDYNKNIPSQKDIEAVQYCINEIKKELPQIKYLKRHSDLNDTTCCGRLFPFAALKLNEVEYATVDQVEKLERELGRIKNIIDRRLGR